VTEDLFFEEELETALKRFKNNQAKDAVNKVLRDEQCGFKKGRGCVNHIFHS